MMIPIRASLRTWAYNKYLFTQAGLEPEAPQSWDELRVAAKKTTRIKNNQVVQLGYKDWTLKDINGWALWYVMAGGKVTINNGRTANLDTLKAREALEHVVALYEIINPVGVDPFPGGWVCTGNVAIEKVGSWVRGGLLENPDIAKDIDFFAARYSPETEPMTRMYVDGPSITRTANEKLAWEFIKFLFEPKRLVEFGVRNNALVTNLEVARNLDLYPQLQDAYYSKAYKLLPYRAEVDWIPRGGSGIFGKGGINEIYQQALKGEISPGNALKQINKIFQVLLDKEFGEQ